MYQPAYFREDRLAIQHELIQKHPLGLLISAGKSGLMANPIPFLLDTTASEQGTLRAHLARANPQLQELTAVSECLIVFQGAQEYITPSWYATKRETGKVVPTWNYATVHVWGSPRVIDDGQWLAQQIDQLTQSQEQKRSAPWKVSDAPSAFTARQLKGIVGLEVEIVRTEGKWKVSQNRPEQDRWGVFDGLHEQGETAEEMAKLVAQYGKLVPPER